MYTKKDFSIVIPYYNKAYEINLVLKSLALQNYDKTKFEVVLIDDGSDNRIDDIVGKYNTIIDINYMYIEHTGNRGKNRNLGVKVSKGERIIFLDSDIVADRNMIKEFDAETKSDQKYISVGLRNLLYNYDKKFLNEDMIEHSFEIFRNFPSRKDPRITEILYEEKSGNQMDGKWQLLYTNCLSLWKSEFEAVEGFDEIFSKNWGAEDVELGYRLFKNGCRIDINQKVETYHLYHSEDFIKRINSLKKNYDIFVKKHPHWLVELFIREYETWAIEMIELQEKIKKREYILSHISNNEELIDDIPNNTLLCGIEDELLLFSEKVKTAFIPESSIKCDKIMNIIGINTHFKDNQFVLALVSREYERLNYGVFTMLIKELERISQKVIIIDVKQSKKEVLKYTNELSHSIGLLHNKNLLFLISNIFSLNINVYYILNLAIACHIRGIKTGINLQFDPRHEIDINSGFLCFSDNKKKAILTELIYHELNFIGDQIPCIIDRIVARSSYRSLGNRILWNEISFYNEEKEYKNDVLPLINKVLLRRSCDSELLSLKDNDNTYHLPVGIDKKIIKNFIGKPKKTNKKFTFLWCDKITDNYTNLDILIESFTELFGKDPNVQLKIIFSGNEIFYIGNEILSESMNLFNANTFYYRKIFFDYYFNSLLDKYKGKSSIVIEYEKKSEEDILPEIYSCDCYINIYSKLIISPLVLWSIAFGKKPIILNNITYEGYGKADNYIRVQCDKRPAIVSEPVFIQVSKLDDRDCRRYYMVDRPDKESLKKVLLYAYKNRDELVIDQIDTREFVEKHDWQGIVDSLITII